MNRYLIAALSAGSIGLATLAQPVFASSDSRVLWGTAIGAGAGYAIGHNNRHAFGKHNEAVGTAGGALIGAAIANNSGGHHHKHRNRRAERAYYEPAPRYYEPAPRYYEERVYSRPYYDDGYYYDY